MICRSTLFHTVAILTLSSLVWLKADGPADNRADKVRSVPPAGILIPEDIRLELSGGVARLGKALDLARTSLSNRSELQARLPDVAVFHKAVDWALRYSEFFRTNEFNIARQHLVTANERLQALQSGSAPWTLTNGLLVAGYVSKIDGSVQPYGLVIPKSWRPDSGRKWRLDTWFHGRGEQLSELAFLADRQRSPGEFTPEDTFVLHLYGRYCNGSRFAGETDFWEALAEVMRRYPIDEERLVVRGFSLGGASAWHFAVHHASRWAAAAPGAGFSETAEFLRVFQNEQLSPSWWEQKLWRLYDATANALNMSMVPLIAYSGEVDSQRQAATAMERALQAEGLELTHLIGPKTGHKYEASAKAELNRRIDKLAATGRVRVPQDVHFITHSLRYNTMAWVTLDTLGEHWEPARVSASLSPRGTQGAALTLQTTNVTGLTLSFGPGDAPFEVLSPVKVRMDGTDLVTPAPQTDRSWNVSFHREGSLWKTGSMTPSSLQKQHGLQGPIDDAFMDAFLMVLPSGKPLNAAAGNWVVSESTRAIEHWRRHYRGDAPQKKDAEVTDADIQSSNLILWGDPSSNQLLARIADRLPVRWTAEGVTVGDKTYSSASHLPILIFPNPLNPKRYVVINSGFTFRDYDYLNNARQTPKLPDWAVIDLSQAPGSRTPGRIVTAGFFGEGWQLK